MSESKRQFETDIVINKKSQGIWGLSGIFNDNLLQIHCWVWQWNNVKISRHLVKLQARKLIASRAQCVGHCPGERWRTHQVSWIWQETAVVNCCYIDFWLSLDNYNNYQTGVDRLYLANWHHHFIRDFDWTLIICEMILLRSPFLFVTAAAYTVSYYVSCWVNIFSSANYIMLTSLYKYFSTIIFSGWILDGSLSLVWQFTQFLRMTVSWRHISQGRVATRLRCGGIFNYQFIANLSQSLSMKEFWKSVNIILLKLLA